MKKLSLALPGFDPSGYRGIVNVPGLKFSGSQATLGAILSDLFIIALYLAIFLTFFWLVWGTFQYLFAGGNKESLAKARSRITWAIVGFIIILLAFAITQYAAQILQPRFGIPLP